MWLILVAILSLLSTASGFLTRLQNVARVVKAPSRISMVNSFYDISETDSKGQLVNFSKFKGKVVYGVNVASKCGFTASGYELLSKVAQLDGVECCLFPCNQFGGQEPGSDAEIENFCALKGVPGANVFTKGDVNGKDTRPTYEYVKKELKMPLVMWNFAGKFIVDKEGKVLPVKDEKNLENVLKRLAAA
jgi:glutathione peroxidase-family protein